ncbi:MAG: DUF5011 domain-containing protein, partial [Clostridiales bacterium]|nr:DUF5011 domain-containing protein [Clostridiales bacterium]
DKTIKQGETLDLNSLVVSAKDKEDGDLIKAVKLTDNGGFNKDKVGKYTVKFKVTDKDGASVTKRAIVTVTYGLATMNEAPTLEVKDKTIKQGEALDLNSLVVSAKDKEDGDLIKAVKLIDNGGFNKDKVGKYTVTFKVTDKDGASATKRAIVTVNYKLATMNEAPTLEVKDKTIKQGEALDLKSLVVSAKDKEDGDLIKAVKLTDNGGFNKDKVGKYTVTFKVTDKDGASATKRAIVTVKYGLATMNEAPTLEVKDKTIKQGEALDLKSLVVSATDKEDGDLIKAVKLIDDGGFNKDKVGKYTVKFKVTDKDGASATKRAVVTVKYGLATMNEAPTLEVKDKTIKQGETLDLKSLVVSATDKEDGDLIKAVKLIDDGGFNKDKVGKYTVTFKVTDKDGASATKRATVTVIEKDKPLPNPEKNKPKHDNSKSKVQDDRISPKTGDSYNLSQYGMLLGLSGILLAAIEIRKRRKES